MSFLGNDEESQKEEKYLKFADPDQGKTTEVKVRILDEKPAKVFRHWIGPTPQNQRPFNCPSRQAGCLACQERQTLKDRGVDHRDTFRMDKRYLVNVLVTTPEGPKTLIFSFGQKLGEKLDFLHDRNGDLRECDLTILKRKTGPAKFNVEYDAIFEGKRKLTAEEKAAAETRHNLDEEIKAAKVEDIANAVNGITPDSNTSGFATPEQIEELTKAAAAKNFTLEHLEVTNVKTLPVEKFTKLITALKS